MQLIELEELESENNFDYNELINSLSEVVLSMIDEEIKHLNTNFLQLKKSLTMKKLSFDESKLLADRETSELAKEKQLNRVLTKIETLNKEGLLRGTNRVSIIKLIPRLKSYTFQQLIKLEEKLSIY